jgi:hypothetical protein
MPNTLPKINNILIKKPITSNNILSKEKLDSIINQECKNNKVRDIERKINYREIAFNDRKRYQYLYIPAILSFIFFISAYSYLFVMRFILIFIGSIRSFQGREEVLFFSSIIFAMLFMIICLSRLTFKFAINPKINIDKHIDDAIMNNVLNELEKNGYSLNSSEVFDKMSPKEEKKMNGMILNISKSVDKFVLINFISLYLEKEVVCNNKNTNDAFKDLLSKINISNISGKKIENIKDLINFLESRKDISIYFNEAGNSFALQEHVSFVHQRTLTQNLLSFDLNIVNISEEKKEEFKNKSFLLKNLCDPKFPKKEKIINSYISKSFISDCIYESESKENKKQEFIKNIKLLNKINQDFNEQEKQVDKSSENKIYAETLNAIQENFDKINKYKQDLNCKFIKEQICLKKPKIGLKIFLESIKSSLGIRKNEIET